MQVPRTGGLAASSVVSGAVVGVGPLQNPQTIGGGSGSAYHLAPGTRFAECPLDNVELFPGGGPKASYRGQQASVRVCALQNLYAAIASDVFTHRPPIFQSIIETPLELRYRGVNRDGLREFRDIAPSAFPLLRYPSEKHMLVGQ